MVYLIAMVLAAVVSIQARTFNNPVLSDKPYYHPDAIKVKDTYYVVAYTLNTTEGIYPLHTSTNLIDWKSAGYIFDSSNTPAWTYASYTQFLSPKIYKIGPNFLLYFTAFNASSGDFDVGVASAPHPLGPYTSTDRPLLALRRQHPYHPSIITDEGKLYLTWSTASYTIDARQLNKNGLSFSSDETITLITPTLPWEGGYVQSPWHFQRGRYHYIMYGGGCNGVGVARSASALGPYDKLLDPIIVPNSNYYCTGHPSVVKDLDDTNDIIVFNALSQSYSVLLASLDWNSDDWPYVEEF